MKEEELEKQLDRIIDLLEMIVNKLDN